MKIITLSTLLCALAGTAHAQVHFGFGGKASASTSSSSPSTGLGRSAGPSEATTQWRRVQESNPAHNVLARLYHYSVDPPPKVLSSDQDASQALSDLKNVARLDDVKQGCAEKRYAGQRAGSVRGEEYFTPETLCPLVDQATELTKKALRELAIAYGMSKGLEFEQSTDKIAKDKLVFMTDVVDGIEVATQRKYVASFVQKYFDALGEPVADAILAGVDAQVARRKEVIVALTSETKIDAPAKKDVAAEHAIVAAYAGKKGIQIQRAWLRDAEWRINRDPIGLIRNRYKNGAILVKAKDASYCAIFPAAVGQAYAGGGNYSKAFDVDEFTTGAPVKCK